MVDVDVSAMSVMSCNLDVPGLPVFIRYTDTMDDMNTGPGTLHDITDMAEDLYSHQYGLFETIKTISNRVKMTQNIIIPLINGTGTVFPVMMVFGIRDSLREYKSNYIILSSMKLSIYNLIIMSESAII
jgi:hypothetical protein